MILPPIRTMYSCWRHFGRDCSIAPVMTVGTDKWKAISCRDAGGEQGDDNSPHEPMAQPSPKRASPLTDPILGDAARPGDLEHAGTVAITGIGPKRMVAYREAVAGVIDDPSSATPSEYACMLCPVAADRRISEVVFRASV